MGLWLVSGSKIQTHRKVEALSSVPVTERRRLIADGLPILLKSAEDLERAEKQLPREHERARAILIGQADEEASKILILLDAIRCPPARQTDFKRTLSNFYRHLARLLYVEACRWRPGTFADLARYVHSERYSHYLDGPNGIEFLYRNDALAEREGFLYADLVDHGHGLEWQVPGPRFGGFPDLPNFNVPKLEALPVAKALARVGAFKPEGLRAIAMIWHQLALDDGTRWREIEECNERTLKTLCQLDLPEEASDEEIVRVREWQFPIYSLDFKEIEVTDDDFERERDAALTGFI